MFCKAVDFSCLENCFLLQIDGNFKQSCSYPGLLCEPHWIQTVRDTSNFTVKSFWKYQYKKLGPLVLFKSCNQIKIIFEPKYNSLSLQREFCIACGISEQLTELKQWLVQIMYVPFPYTIRELYFGRSLIVSKVNMNMNVFSLFISPCTWCNK